MPSLDLETLLAEEIAAAEALPRDLTKLMPAGARHPMDRPLGPVRPRGNPSGLVVQGARELVRFGDCTSPEVTFSCAKSYLSALAGIAHRDGLLPDLDEPVGARIKDGGFDSDQNRAVTWRHLLQQTSEWEGELFGLPDWLDRGRTLGGSGGDGTVGSSATGTRTLGAPGTFWEYNDVRVNRLSLALLRLFGEPLGEVLKREIMAPLGSPCHFEWHGYETSFVDVGGRSLQSVSGGSHWGGGLWISTEDHARFGALYLQEGRAGDRQILPPGWIPKTREPCALNEGYGLLFWLNAGGALSEVAGPDAFAAKGAGGHTIFIWPEREMVIVLRWMPDAKAAIDKVLASLPGQT